jgi:hypothetical protein
MEWTRPSLIMKKKRLAFVLLKIQAHLLNSFQHKIMCSLSALIVCSTIHLKSLLTTPFDPFVFDFERLGHGKSDIKSIIVPFTNFQASCQRANSTEEWYQHIFSQLTSN